MSGNDKKNDRERQECQWAVVQSYMCLLWLWGKKWAQGGKKRYVC